MVKKIINKLFYFCKMIMLMASFVLTLYIVVYMYKRLEKNLADAITVFIPFILIFVLFSVNIIMNQKGVKNCMFYNVTCCAVFGLLLFTGYRAIYDDYMVANKRLGYGINFNYYADMIAPMQIMVYGLCVSNIILMFDKTKNTKEIENKEVSENKKYYDQIQHYTKENNSKKKSKNIKKKSNQ